MPDDARVTFTDHDDGITADVVGVTVTVLTGDRGPQGAQGPQGAAGSTGPQGVPGAAGSTGPQGAAGSDGAAGPQGAAGAAGAQGAAGSAGTTGPQGVAGPQGPQGATGTSGAQGATGPQGVTGPTGPQGTTGAAGPTGPQGAIGTTGPQGATGSAGPQGAAGTTGTQGPQGAAGATGGTGPQGTQGPQGATGAAGGNPTYDTLANRPSAGTAGDKTLYFATDSNGGTLFQVQSGAWTAVARGLSEAILKSLGTTKGDQIGFTGSATPVRHAIGADGTVQIADSAQSDGWKWGVPGLLSLRDTYLRPSTVTYETIPRASQINSSGSLTSGTLLLMAIALPKGAVISNITWVSGGTAAVTPTHWWFSLHDSSRVQLATTADQTSTAWAGNTTKTLSIATIASGASSTFTTTYEGLHYVGIMMTAATTVTLSCCQQSGGVGTFTPVLGGTSSTSLTTPPAFAFTAGALTTTSVSYYAGAA